MAQNKKIKTHKTHTENVTVKNPHANRKDFQVNKYTFDIMQKFYLNKFYYNYYYNFCSTAISAGDLGLASSPPVFLHMCIIGTSGNL